MSLTIKPNTTVVTLLQGDDLDPIVARAEAVQGAVRTETLRRIGDADSATPEAVREFDEFMDEVVDRAVKVRMTQLPRKKYKELRNEHPPRMVAGENGPTEHPADARWGFNNDTFGDVIVPACVDLDQFDGSEQARDEFLDSLSDGWFSKLFSAAVSLNQGSGPDPKVRLSSKLAPTSDEISESPDRLA